MPRLFNCNCKIKRPQKWGSFQLWLSILDGFLNFFLYENILETNPSFQAVELGLAKL